MHCAAAKKAFPRASSDAYFTSRLHGSSLKVLRKMKQNKGVFGRKKNRPFLLPLWGRGFLTPTSKKKIRFSFFHLRNVYFLSPWFWYSSHLNKADHAAIPFHLSLSLSFFLTTIYNFLHWAILSVTQHRRLLLPIVLCSRHVRVKDKVQMAWVKCTKDPISRM